MYEALRVEVPMVISDSKALGDNCDETTFCTDHIHINIANRFNVIVTLPIDHDMRTVNRPLNRDSGHATSFAGFPSKSLRHR